MLLFTGDDNKTDYTFNDVIDHIHREDDEDDGFNVKDIELIAKKRIVFIIDECQRSTFGDMLITIKNTFKNAIFFGFTGTPIQD